MQAFSLGEASRDLFSFLFQYLSINLSISFASFWSVIWALICVLAIDECLLIICKEMLPIRGNHIAVGNTRITGEEKEVSSSLQLHLIRLKARLYNLSNEALSNARGRLFSPRSIVPLQKADLALHTTLQQLLDVSRCKDNPSLTKGLISRLR